MVNKEYPDVDIVKFEQTFKKLQEYFDRRDVVHSGSAVSLFMLDEVDEFSFLRSSKIPSDVGTGTIDEIHIQHKPSWGHPLPAFSSAYIQNRHFTPRKHRAMNLMGPDGHIDKERGESCFTIRSTQTRKVCAGDFGR